MRHKNGTASPGAKHLSLPLRAATRGISASPTANLPPLRRNPLAAALFLALNGGAALAAGPAGNPIRNHRPDPTRFEGKGAAAHNPTAPGPGGDPPQFFSPFFGGPGKTPQFPVAGAAA